MITPVGSLMVVFFTRITLGNLQDLQVDKNFLKFTRNEKNQKTKVV